MFDALRRCAARHALAARSRAHETDLSHAVGHTAQALPARAFAITRSSTPLAFSPYRWREHVRWAHECLGGVQQVRRRHAEQQPLHSAGRMQTLLLDCSRRCLIAELVIGRVPGTCTWIPTVQRVIYADTVGYPIRKNMMLFVRTIYLRLY